MFKKNFAGYLIFGLIVICSCDKNDDENPIVEDRSDWMSELVSEHLDDDIALSDISIPGSHDAGTYIFRGCSVGANACNTRNQNLDFTEQLSAGIRAFDVRPVIAAGKYFTQHVTACDGLGCKGDLMQNLLDQTKSFLDEHNELVILFLNNFCYTGSTDADLVNLINNTLGDRVFKDNSTESIDFINTPLKNIIVPGEVAGKVVVIYEGAANSLENRSNGIFASSYISVAGSYANAQEYEVMRSDQLQKFNNWNGSNSRLFGLSWTLTMDEKLAVPCAINPNATSIQDMANSINIHLEDDMNAWMSNGTMSSGKIVNILWSDFVTHEMTDVCLNITNFNLE